MAQVVERLQQHLKQELAENPFLEMSEADVQQEVELDEEGKEEKEDEVEEEVEVIICLSMTKEV